MTYFLSQSFPGIRTKLKHLEKGPLTPQAEVLLLALRCTMGYMFKGGRSDVKLYHAAELVREVYGGRGEKGEKSLPYMRGYSTCA